MWRSPLRSSTGSVHRCHCNQRRTERCYQDQMSSTSTSVTEQERIPLHEENIFCQVKHPETWFKLWTRDLTQTESLGSLQVSGERLFFFAPSAVHWGPVLAISHRFGNSGLGLPKSILKLRRSLSNWLKMIWDLLPCQFLNLDVNQLWGSVCVSVCVWAEICLRACVLHSAALTRFQGLCWDCLKRNQEFSLVLVSLWGPALLFLSQEGPQIPPMWTEMIPVKIQHWFKTTD